MNKIVREERPLNKQGFKTPKVSNKQLSAIRKVVKVCKQHNLCIGTTQGLMYIGKLTFLKITADGAYLMKTCGRDVGRIVT